MGKAKRLRKEKMFRKRTLNWAKAMNHWTKNYSKIAYKEKQ